MDNRIIGKRIAERRKRLGMTQKQLADQLHITDRAVSRWERGVGAPDVSLLVPLADALSMSTDELLRGIAVTAEKQHRPDDSPHLIPFRHCLITMLAPVVWPVLTIILLCMPSCPNWLLYTAVLLQIPWMIASFLVCLHRFYRCPRCGHVLWYLSSMENRVTYSILHPGDAHCHICGKPIFVDRTAWYRILDFFRPDRPRL